MLDIQDILNISSQRSPDSMQFEFFNLIIVIIVIFNLYGYGKMCPISVQMIKLSNSEVPGSLNIRITEVRIMDVSVIVYGN